MKTPYTQTIINFQLQQMADLMKKPLDCNVIALISYTIQILVNMGLTVDEAYSKAQALNK